MNDEELDRLLRAMTPQEQTVLERIRRGEAEPPPEQTYVLLKKVGEREYRLPPPEEAVAVTRQSRFMPVPPHRHDVIELAYMYAGRTVHTVNGERIVLSEGEALILDTNVVHTVEPAGEGDLLVNVLMNKSFFDDTMMSRLSGRHALANFLVRAIYEGKEYNDYIVFHSGGNAHLHRLIRQLLQEYYGRRLGSDEAVRWTIALVLLELLRVYEVQSARPDMPKKAVLTEMLKYVDEHYARVTLADLAERFNFHPNYVSAFIKAGTGKTFKDIVFEKRLGHARLMLRHTSLDIETVAKNCGFSNLTFFYRKFRESYGQSPGEARGGRPRPGRA